MQSKIPVQGVVLHGVSAGVIASISTLASADWLRTDIVPTNVQSQGLVGAAVAVTQSADAVSGPNNAVGAALWAGAPLATATARASGAIDAWTFSAYTLQWFHAGKLISGTPQSGAMFGAALASTGPKLVVGSPRYRLPGAANAGTYKELAGTAELFSIALPYYSPATATSVALTPPGLRKGGELYGYSVAAADTASNGFIALVGSPGFDLTGATDAGKIHAFRQSGTSAPEYLQELVLPDPAPSDHLGASIAFNGTTAFAGVDRAGGQVAAFPIVDASFGAPTMIAAPEGMQHVAGFGRALAADGGFIAVGAPGDSDYAWEEGRVLIFDAAPPYTLRSVVASPFPGECAGFGITVSLRRGTLVVGTANGTELLADGAVAVYSIDSGTGAAVQQAIVMGPPTSGFGSAVATSGAHIALGAPTTGASLSGSVIALSSRTASRSPDLNGDGVVNGTDLGLMLSNFRASVGSNSAPDLNYDGSINGADLAILLGAWGTSG